MKKCIAPLIILVVLFSTLISASAETSKMEISFKLGSDTVNVNGKTMKTEKTFAQDGNVMVAAEIISQGFGANVQYNSTDKSVTVTYQDVTILLFIDQKKGMLNGKEISIASGPVLQGDVVMLPIKFIAESFGADCTFDGKTQEVKVIKEIAGDKSIKDFSLILKKTAKDKVGDSYYKWEMTFPKGLKISDRSFDGRNTSFEAMDGSYQIYINIYQNNHDTINSLMTTDLNYFSDYTLVSQGKVKKDNLEYSKSVFKSDYGVWQVRNYLSDQWVFELSLYMDDYEKYINSTVDKDILDTFSLGYQAESQLEDLSDISKEGFRKYEDKTLKFSVDVAPEWAKDEYSNKYNTIEFFDAVSDSSDFNNQFCVNMYSYETGFTLDHWVKNIYQNLQDYINPDYYKIIKEENGVINGVPCKKIYYSQNLPGETVYSCDVLLLGKHYKYNVFYYLNSATYENPQKLALFEKALNSFKFSEPDPQKVGSLMDPYDIEQTNEKILKSNAQYKWSMEISANYKPQEDNNDRDQAFYSNDRITMQLIVQKNIQLEGMIEYLDEDLAKGLKLGTHKEVDKKVINEKGTKVYQYTYLVEVNEVEVALQSYLLSKNGNLYVVDIACPKMYLSENHKKEMEEIWQSMKFD